MKKIYKIIIGIILLIIVANISWYLIVQNKYGSYIKKIPENDMGLHYITDEDGYHYNVKMPDYFSLTGNLAVTEKNDNYGLIIWPSILENQYKYGVTITENDNMYMVEVDKNFKPLEGYDEKIISLVEKYKSNLEVLLKRAKDMWEF